MVKAIMNGCGGAMGRVISDIIANDEAIEIVAGVDMNTEIQAGYPVYKTLEECHSVHPVYDCDASQESQYQILHLPVPVQLLLILLKEG